MYQLEEYGMPRMISRKIQDSGLINLEDDSVEISDIITQFNCIGKDKLISNLNSRSLKMHFILNNQYINI